MVKSGAEMLLIIDPYSWTVMSVMQAYRAYFERGCFVPLTDVDIPEGSQAIVTVLEEPSGDVSSRQRASMSRFREAVRSAGPLPPAYDEVMRDRMNIAREIDL